MQILNDKNIVHMDLDAFFVSVERIKEPKLKGIPLLIGGSSERGVVASCSYEARKFGIHSAMPMKLAKRLCPHATVIGGDPETYSNYSNWVTEIIAGAVPLYEKSSIDEFYLDLSGMERFHSTDLLAKKISDQIRKELGLVISFGHSINKTVAKVATNQSKPNGHCRVEKGAERSFLAPLTVNKIPQLGDKTYRLLSSMGVIRVKTLQAMPPEPLEQLLGKNGRKLWQKAQGIDHSPVIPYRESKSVSAEQTFDRDTADSDLLRSTLVQMTEKLAFRLRKQRKLTACISLKIRYSDFDTSSVQSHISYTACDHLLIPKVKELFDRLYRRRLLIRLLGVRFSHLVSGHDQIHLFEDTEEQIQLYRVMDAIRLRYGTDKIKRALSVTANK